MSVEAAFGRYCRESKPPINSGNCERLSEAVAAFSAGYDALKSELGGVLDDRDTIIAAQAARIEELEGEVARLKEVIDDANQIALERSEWEGLDDDD